MKKMMLIAMMGIVLCGCGTPKGKEYPMTTVVSEINEKADEVVCIDFNGNEWVFTGVEDWIVGDIASMIMNDKGTPIIYDDEIVSVRYDGWLEGYWGWDGEAPIFEWWN